MTWDQVVFEDLYDCPSRNGLYKKKEFHGSGTKIVNMGELFGFDFISNQDMKRLELTDDELNKFRLVEGDLLFGRRSLVESGAGKCSLVGKVDEPLVFESSIIRVRLKNILVNPKFYFYYFMSHAGRSKVMAIVSGVNVKGIRGSDLKKLFVDVPPMDTQNKIASILSAYDNLLENNNRRIALLEKSARLLYREWFVRLRFPGHENTRITDGVPEGWERRPLGEICFQHKQSVKPSDIVPGTPYIGLAHIPRRSITLSDWDVADEINSNKFEFETGDILFGKIRPYFHKVGFTLCDGVTSSDAIVIRPYDEQHYSYLLMHVSSDMFVTLASKTVKEGSKMPRADWSYLTKQPLLVPSVSINNVFDGIIKPILKQLETLASENQKLKTARDLLLPKLMNGEIPV